MDNDNPTKEGNAPFCPMPGGAKTYACDNRRRHAKNPNKPGPTNEAAKRTNHSEVMNEVLYARK